MKSRCSARDQGALPRGAQKRTCGSRVGGATREGGEVARGGRAGGKRRSPRSGPLLECFEKFRKHEKINSFWELFSVSGGVSADGPGGEAREKKGKLLFSELFCTSAVRNIFEVSFSVPSGLSCGRLVLLCIVGAPA